MTPRHQAALELAAQGVPVIPLRGKIPAVGHGFKSESDNPDLINEWWSREDYNIGVRPYHMGLVAIDLDHAKPGGVSQAFLDLLPTTRTHRTPSGGEHRLYLSLETYGNAWVAQNVDIRSENGYILWPPSVINGVEYRVEDEREPEMLPERLARNMRTKAEADAPEPCDDTGVDADEVGAREWCAKLKEQGDYDRFALAAGLTRNFGLTDSTATRLCEEFGLRTWTLNGSETTWQQTLNNARKHGSGSLGEGVAFKYPKPKPVPEAWKVAAIEGNNSAEGGNGAVVSTHNRFGHRDPEEAANRPPIVFWDKHKTLPRGPYVGFAIGESGSHKSGVFLKYALDIIEAGGRVLFVAAEGAYGVETARLPRAREQRNMEWAPLKAGWCTCVDSFNLLRPEDMQELCAAYADFAPDAIFIDVIGKVVPDINEPKYGMAIMNALQQLALHFQATVVSAHHPPLSDSKRGLGSIFLHALADFEWLVKKSGDKIWLSVSKMKDGAAEFDVPYGIDTTQGVPVIIDCERKSEEVKPPHPVALAIREFLDKTSGNEAFDLAGIVEQMRALHVIPPGIKRGDEFIKARLDGIGEYLTKNDTGKATSYHFARPTP